MMSRHEDDDAGLYIGSQEWLDDRDERLQEFDPQSGYHWPTQWTLCLHRVAEHVRMRGWRYCGVATPPGEQWCSWHEGEGVELDEQGFYIHPVDAAAMRGDDND